MVKAHIYLEGGGGKDLNSRCREGFNKLLKKCGFEGRMPRLTASGGRDSAYGDFATAHAGACGQDYIAMLVDSEHPVKDVHSPGRISSTGKVGTCRWVPRTSRCC